MKGTRPVHGRSWTCATHVPDENVRPDETRHLPPGLPGAALVTSRHAEALAFPCELRKRIVGTTDEVLLGNNQ